MSKSHRSHLAQLVCLGIACLFCPAPTFTADPPQESQAEIYDAKADAKAQIAAATAVAKKQNKRVLVRFGGNWCEWCHRMHKLFAKDKEIAPLVRADFEVVPVDIGEWDKNLDVVKAYGADIEKYGVPFLTVLDANGKVLVNQDTNELEVDEKYDLSKVKAFLEKWAPQPLDAQQVLKEALAKAAADKKLVLVHLGAPWCGWCTRLDQFLAKHQALFASNYLDLKIDFDRMANGGEVAKRLRSGESGGIPWMAILDPQGNVLITSDGPQGNIGYPYKPEEISHFLEMLKKTAKKLEPQQLAQIEEALKAAGEKPR